MARRPTTPSRPPAQEHIVDIDVATEMQSSFLEYAYSVIYSRALPDARDGLKPVQRRILFTMSQMGLRPDRGHVKSARVVGEVMGRLHPHGDGAIYDAMVRMAQPFVLRLPLVDGHGNFGSLDDGPAAYRYTEARPAAAALAMTQSLDEDVVDFAPNYDGREQEPVVLPAAIPALLVNGASGIAVGMATNLPPHNLNEVVAAARHLLDHPQATVEELMAFVPGPDLPTGGVIAGLDSMRDIYAEGRGSFKMRATVAIEQVTPRRQGLVVTELPYNIGPEKVIERIKDAVTSKKLDGISDVIELSDGLRGTRLVIELKPGFNPHAVLAQLYKQTPLEEQFSVNAVALVDGRPQTLGLRQLLQVFLDHRVEVVRRRSEFRRARATERLHLVDGLLIAIVDIDEVIAVIRSSEDTAEARTKLRSVFDLSEVQTNYILEMPLRRLTKFSKLELETEQKQLQADIAELSKLLANPKAIAKVVSNELAEVAAAYGTARRTVLQDADGSVHHAELEVADEPTLVMLSASGLLARLPLDAVPNSGSRSKHDVIIASVATSTRGEVGLLTNRGRIHRVPVVELPGLTANATSFNLKGGSEARRVIGLDRGEEPLTLVPLDEASVIALGTARGVVKRVSPELPRTANWEVIRLDAGDSVVGGGVTTSDDAQLVFVTSDAQLLRFDARQVRPQGRGAGGMAGIRLAEGASVIGFFVAAADAEVVTVAVSGDGLPGTDPGSAKRTPLADFPGKGRGTGGVRCQQFRKGEDRLTFALVAHPELRLATSAGQPVELVELGKRDGTGHPQTAAIACGSGTIRR